MVIKLIVIRTPDLQALSKFYKALGVSLKYHKHGKSPYHSSGSVGETVIEIYPLAKDQATVDTHLRIGIGLDDFDNVMSTLKSLEVRFIMEPGSTEFGYMAIVMDPDSRKVELYKTPA